MKNTKPSSTLIAAILAWICVAVFNHSDFILVTLLTIPFFFFLPGYFLLKTIWGKTKKVSTAEGLILSIGLSFILSYPLGFLNTAYEVWMGGDPFQFHRDSLWFIYGFFVFLFFTLSRTNKSFFTIKKFKTWIDFFRQPESLLLLLVLGLALAARLIGTDFQNINGDEQELSLYSYHLVDGIVVGRNALFLSQSGHSPLGFYVSFLIYQSLSPLAYDSLNQEWMIRLPMLVFGILEIVLFWLFAKKLKLSLSLKFFGAILLALNTYAIFGSRLMIPQDGAIFTFFLWFFSYFLLLFLDRSPGWLTRTEFILISLFLAAIFLVKFSAIFLVPLIVLTWIVKRGHILQLHFVFLLTLLFFSPVIIFNTAAYLSTGYMDVPFAKIANLIGIPAISIMGNEDLYSGTFPPFLLTEIGFFHMLIDQWTQFFLLSVISTLVLMSFYLTNFRKQSTYLFYFLWLGVIAIVFFGFNGYRAYYAEFLTLPAILIVLMLMDYFFQSKFKPIQAMVLIWVVFLGIQTFRHSLNSHWLVLDPPAEQGEYGRNELYTYEELHSGQSLASWSFLRDDGFSVLQDRLKGETRLLVIDDEFLDQYLHHFRWYVGIHRDVEQHYLGEAYHEPPYTRLSIFSEEGETTPALLILPYSEITRAAADEILFNHNGTPKMLLRELN